MSRERNMNGGEPADLTDLTAAILRRTTGRIPICRKIEDRLCAWVDGRLSGIDSDLVAGHVEHCAECLSIALALRGLAEDLPLLADVEPDVRFVIDVLDRTSRRKADRPDPIAWLDTAWARLIRRPRIAQEIAYCVVMVLVLVFGTSSRRENPLREEGPALSLRAAGQFARGADLVSGMALRLREEVASGNSPRVPLPVEARTIESRVRRVGIQVGRTWDLASLCGRRVGEALLRWDAASVWIAIQEFRRDVRECWKEKNRGSEPSRLSERIPPQIMQPTDSRCDTRWR